MRGGRPDRSELIGAYRQAVRSDGAAAAGSGGEPGRNRRWRAVAPFRRRRIREGRRVKVLVYHQEAAALWISVGG